MHYLRKQAHDAKAAALSTAPRPTPLTLELLPQNLREEVIAYKLARNQQLDQFERPWTDADVLLAALTRGAETLHDTTAYLMRRA